MTLVYIGISNTAFTLIELLVVIAIITVLAVLAFPAFSQLVGRARDSKSLNNLSQIAKGLILYATDNETYPLSVDNASGFSDFWVNAVKPYLGNQTNVFICPNEKKHNPLSDYGVNDLVITPTRVGPAAVVTGQRRPTTIPRPARTVMVSDARDTSGSQPAGSWVVSGALWIRDGTNMHHPFAVWPPRNSGNKVFAAFGDGRVESIPGERWATDREEFFDPTYAP
jgi:prepilin-type N-terminal cleavage/methylation domain-containing protein